MRTKAITKAKDDEVVTTRILDERLAHYPTRIEVEMMFETWSIKIDDNARKYRDEILTKMDQIVGELAQMREDREFDKYDARRNQEQLDDHEKRISKLESQGN